MIRPVIPYVVAALLFGLGVYGVLRRRNAVLVLMAVELMLNAVNLILVTADTTVRAALAGAGLSHTGAVFTLFVVVIAAAEVGVGLAVILHLYRMRNTVVMDDLPLAGTETADEAGSETADEAGSETADVAAQSERVVR